MTLLALILIATTACSDETPSTQETQSQSDGQLNDGAQVNSMDASVEVADALADLREDGGSGPEPPSRVTIDLNGDGRIKILLLSSSRGIESNRPGFAVNEIALKLQTMLESDEMVDSQVLVTAQDLYRTTQLETGYGQGGDVYNWPYFCHSIMQYLVWPDGLEQRLQNLRGMTEHDWDHIIVTGDPGIVLTTPGFHALGVHELATLAAEGDAQLHILVGWTNQPDDQDRLSYAAELIQTNARFEIGLIPAAKAWWSIADTLRDSGPGHPSENGAKLAAATIVSHFLDRQIREQATGSDLDLYSAAYDAVRARRETPAASASDLGDRPFGPASISARKLHFNHTGTSSENGILRGLRWVTAQGRVALERGGDAPIHFNYGRANTEFEANKRYRIAPDEFDYSLGFPMQDHSNHGDVTMLYGLDKRRSDDENGTDLGVARKMSRDDELPHARTIPIRTLHARLRAALPDQSAYSDGWHMNHDLDKASGAFMYTLLTGHCALGDEPEDQNSPDWRAWLAHKTGFQTAWSLMTLSGHTPCLRVLPSDADSRTLRAAEPISLSVSLGTTPTTDVKISIVSNAAVQITPNEFIITPDDHLTPREVTVQSAEAMDAEMINIRTVAQSEDPAYDGVEDNWIYLVD
ncbi:MAG: hypothetical protein ACON3Z_15785 [Bradymonadia bacterium]